ncbi:ankyrin repeat domain-containing protein [Candidatus Tisiphia endosymbiont of Nemotelus uliginosus]|uniref:ankyrin repeat domain-containing protein n=1 Tax=Candidatus Tisiphia endosymbiont of Nemotelus uliginosus TaxID=3077926 RepID=UPI0035C92C70
MVCYLVKVGANIENTQNNFFRPLGEAIHRKHQSIVEYLLKRGANVTHVHLKQGAKQNNFDIVKCLLKGALQEKEYISALLTEVKEGNLPMVKCLVEYSNNVNAIIGANSEFLKVAISNGNLELVKYLVAHGANVKADVNQPLMLAIENTKVDIVKFLLAQGADPTAPNCTPLTYAAQKKSTRDSLNTCGFWSY